MMVSIRRVYLKALTYNPSVINDVTKIGVVEVAVVGFAESQQQK